MTKDFHLISESDSFYKISNEMYKVEIRWTKDIFNDLIDLSEFYFDSAYEICSEIVNDKINDNIKNDMWFLPCVYLFRQSIELLIKAGLAKTIKCKPDLQEELVNAKHNLLLLFNTYKDKNNSIQISVDEFTWLEIYLQSIENIDKNSDLFRYPFKDEFLSQYRNKSLDIVNMANRLINCYSILTKCFLGHRYKDKEVDISEMPEFLSFASDGIGNCYLWDSPRGDGFHKQVIGYSKTGKFLFNLYKKSKRSNYVYPIIFLLRNAIELTLKRILHVQTEFKIPDYKIKRIRNTHILYKDLWVNIKPVLKHYANISGEDLQKLDIAEKYIVEINSVDKNGDMFRYPFSYSFDYRFDNKLIDIENVYIYLQSIFNFLDGCNGWLYNIHEYETEMNSYYKW